MENKRDEFREYILNRHKEARDIMAGRDLNEQINETKNIVKRAIGEGARRASQVLNLDPSSEESKEITSTYMIGYIMENKEFIQQNKSQPELITEDVTEKIVASYQRDNVGEIEFRDDKDEIVRRLKNNVVRLTFTKKDGSDRVMYATLVPELMNIYNNHGRKYGDRGSTSLSKVEEMNRNIPDFVRVIDLEKEEFRAFKPSTLKDYDNDFNVPSWIECHPDNDAWYEVAKEGADIREYVDGNGLFIQASNSSERRRREDGYIQEAQDNGILVDDETASALEYIANNADKTVKGYIYTLTRLQIPEEVQHYINTNQFFRDLKDLCEDLREVASTEIQDEAYDITKSPQKVNSSGGAYTINVGTDQYYFHPYFVINRRTGKVYLDRMDWAEETEASRGLPRPVKRVDRLFGDTINNFLEEKGIPSLPKPQNRRIRKTDRTYEIRFNRMQQFAKNPKKVYQPVYDSYNITAKEIPSNASVLVRLKDLKLSFEVSPTMIVAWDLVENKPIKLVTVKRGTSTLRELRDGLNAYKTKYRGTTQEDRVNRGVAVIEELFLENLFNLRRKNLFPEVMNEE